MQVVFMIVTQWWGGFKYVGDIFKDLIYGEVNVKGSYSTVIFSFAFNSI